MLRQNGLRLVQLPTAEIYRHRSPKVIRWMGAAAASTRASSVQPASIAAAVAQGPNGLAVSAPTVTSLDGQVGCRKSPAEAVIRQPLSADTGASEGAGRRRGDRVRP